MHGRWILFLPGATATNPNRWSKQLQKRRKYDIYPPNFSIRGYSYVVIQILFSTIFVGWTVWKQKTEIVKASQPLFLSLLVCGTVVSMSSILPQGAQTTYRYLKDPATGEITDQPNPDVRLVDIACVSAIFPVLPECAIFLTDPFLLLA